MTFASPQDAVHFLELNPDIELFELFILDNNGVPRGKLLHRDELLAVYESGRPLPSTILGLTINGNDVENSGLVWEVGDIDCRAYPISGSLQRMPWRLIPTAAVQVSMHPKEGLPATIADPRHLLAKVIEGLQADGYYPVMAAELEFYLLDQQRDSNGRSEERRVGKECRSLCDWSSDVCSSDLLAGKGYRGLAGRRLLPGDGGGAGVLSAGSTAR